MPSNRRHSRTDFATSSRVLALATAILHVSQHVSAVVLTGGAYTSYLLKDNGELWGWGYNGVGELIDSPTSLIEAPMLLSSDGFKSISAGTFMACGITATDGVRCWGRNNFGQLGDGTTSSSRKGVTSATTDVITDAVAVSTGEYHSCAIKAVAGTDNQVRGGLAVTLAAAKCSLFFLVTPFWFVRGATQVYCWGSNGMLQLGVSSPSQSSTPVLVSLPGANPVAIASQFSGTCVVTAAGGLRCWGSYKHTLPQGGTFTPSTGYYQLTAPSADIAGITGVTLLRMGALSVCYMTTGTLNHHAYTSGGCALGAVVSHHVFAVASCSQQDLLFR